MSQEPRPPTRQPAVPCILLVDDHPPNLLALEAVLAPLELRLVCATSGNEALRYLLREEFAAIVLDVQMPDMDGFEAASLIRGVERTRQVPIIFVSAIHRDDAFQAKGYAHGAVDYLIKPFNPDVLRAKIAALADLWRRGESIRAREAQLFERERAVLLARERRAQAEAASSAALLDALVARAPVGIAIFDRDLRYERINAALAEMNGVPAPAHLGRTLTEILPPAPETTAIAEHLRQVLETGEPLLNLEVAWLAVGPSGQRYSLASYFPVRVADEVTRVAVTVVDLTARRAAEARAAAERDNLHRLITQAPVAIALVRGRTHVFEIANPLYLRIFGRHDVVGKPVREVFPEAELAARGLWDIWDRAYTTGEPFNAPEYVVTWDRRGDGSREDGVFSFTLTPVRDETGAVSGLMAVAIEVTEQVHARQRVEALALQLVESEARFRAVAETMPQLVWSARADGVHDYFNQRWYEYTGLSRDQTEGGGWADAVHPDDRERILSQWAEALRTADRYEVEVRFRRHDGVYCWFLGRALPTRDAEGTITRWFGTCTQIDDQKRAEARAARLQSVTAALSEAHTTEQVAEVAVSQGRAALDAERGVLGMLTEQGLMLELVRSAGYDEARLAAWRRMPVTQRLPMTDVVREQRAIFYETGADLFERYPELEGHRAPGDEAFVAVPLMLDARAIGVLALAFTVRRVFDEADKVLITTLARVCAQALERARLYDAEARARAEAESANRAKDEFLALVSHELRSPLNASLGWTKMLRDGIVAEEKRERALSIVERNMRTQVALIEDLLDISRIEAGKMRLEVQALDLTSIIESAIEAVRPAAEAKNIRLQHVLDSDGAILGDPDRLLQIVSNLLGNAVKFTPKGGWVRIHLRRVESSIELTVTDNGQGIPPEFLPYVFDKFRQADSGMTRAHGGLGLGLAIVENLVELHGGTIAAHSEGTGKGASFVVRLPIAPVQSRDRSQAPNLAEGPSVFDCPPELDGLRILVVDDEEDAREFLVSMLDRCHAKITAVGSVAEAIAAFQREPPDVLVSDVGMPGATGYDLIRKVRALPPEQGGNVPAVALTAYSHVTDRTRALLAGFTSHVAKPVEPAELIVVIASLAGRLPRR